MESAMTREQAFREAFARVAKAIGIRYNRRPYQGTRRSIPVTPYRLNVPVRVLPYWGSRP